MIDVEKNKGHQSALTQFVAHIATIIEKLDQQDTVEDVLKSAIEQGAPMLQAAGGYAYLFDETGAMRLHASTLREEDIFLRQCAKGQGIVGEVWASGRAMRKSLMDKNVAQDELAAPIFLDSQLIAIMGMVKPIHGHSFFEGDLFIFTQYALLVERTLRNQRLLSLQKQNEQELHLLASIIDCSNDGVVHINKDRKVVIWNKGAERITGFCADEVRGRDFLFIVRPERHQIVKEIFASLLRGDDIKDYVASIIKKDGSTVSLFCSWSRIQSDGVIFGFTIVARDITESNRLREKAERVQRMEAIGTMASGIAHDFNNMLAVILGYTEMALNEEKKGSAISSMEKVLHAGIRARGLVKQILAFSRQVSTDHKPMHLSHTIEETLTMMRAILPSTIEIVTDIKHVDEVITADATQMHQLIVNLCLNAEHAMRGTGGRISVSLYTVDKTDPSPFPEMPSGAYVVLVISDTGHGIKAELVERIFEPFFTTKPIGEGTGLGLAVVHGIVKSHSGYIFVKSDEGKGASFRIFFPKTNGATQEEHCHKNSRMRERAVRVLVVDDDPSIVAMTESFLSELDCCEIIAFTDSVEAFAYIRSHVASLDLVITDQTMPKMTGERLVASIHHIRPDLPIILCTGFAGAPDSERSKHNCFCDFLYKPFLKQELHAAVHRALFADGDPGDGCSTLYRRE
ncbi:PAS domain S-box protein [Heliobacterium gestii]|uniref:Stage 0 sporulation protein A homolog n=1 Tax=Heliomicrobium gestii TaxID=2699 RepID=A0A845LF69_HELGE|nr:ATP-binding protein [Heliomicrobium gestii]MBM7867930.1 PAS domain S-box-containing protein [Heliomicrobium gestii]MZP43259.1 PAS domain S-box protein [Heliomicrobium gestii]